MAKILLPFKNGKKAISIDDVVFCEADGKYSTIHLSSGKNVLVCKSLGELEEILSKNIFCRSHRKYLINLNYLEEISSGRNCNISLRNNVKLPVAVRRKKQIIDFIKQTLAEL